MQELIEVSQIVADAAVQIKYLDVVQEIAALGAFFTAVIVIILIVMRFVLKQEE